MLINIKRFEHDRDQANRGLMLIDGEFFGFTLECPNLHNYINDSRILAGTYIARRVTHGRYKGHWYLLNVVNRTGIILGHAGSYVSDFKGCIGMGDDLLYFNSERAIKNTKKHCKGFLTITENQDTLTVIIEDI